MKRLKLLIVLAGFFTIMFSSCDDQSPGIEYMPDMYRSRAVEAYSETVLTLDNKSALQPAENSIPRGFLPYPYPNTNEGYEMAGENLKNPIPFSEEELKKGKEIYSNFCVHCHGKKGDGKGSVPENSDYPNPPSYQTQLKDLPAGKIFHTLMYGKNLMGSHASQISKEDRWRLVYYVQSLQDADRFDKMYRGAGEEMPDEEGSEMPVGSDEESTDEMAMN
jgi:mono/diheme cytochrome c family protein